MPVFIPAAFVDLFPLARLQWLRRVDWAVYEDPVSGERQHAHLHRVLGGGWCAHAEGERSGAFTFLGVRQDVPSDAAFTSGVSPELARLGRAWFFDTILSGRRMAGTGAGAPKLTSKLWTRLEDEAPELVYGSVERSTALGLRTYFYHVVAGLTERQTRTGQGTQVLEMMDLVTGHGRLASTLVSPRATALVLSEMADHLQDAYKDLFAPGHPAPTGEAIRAMLSPELQGLLETWTADCCASGNAVALVRYPVGIFLEQLFPASFWPAAREAAAENQTRQRVAAQLRAAPPQQKNQFSVQVAGKPGGIPQKTV